MVPQTQTAGSEAQVGTTPVRKRASTKRWPLLFSLLGAFAVSALLWVGIFYLFDFLMGWL